MTECRLEDIALFRDLSADEIEIARSSFTFMDLEQGRALIVEGEPGDDMFILVEGRVRVSKSMILAGLSAPILEAEDPRKVLATMDAGEHPFFGEMALIDQDIRSATVAAVDDCRFLRITREDFYALIGKSPALGVKLLLALCRRLAASVRRNNGEIIKLTTALALLISRKKSS